MPLRSTRRKRPRSNTARWPRRRMSACCRCAPCSRYSRPASAIAATAFPRPALPPAASAPIRPICAGRRSISSLRPRSPTIRNSSLSTPYTAWALAARHRQRAFVFWTYVIALAEDPLVRLTAENLAREALSDGNLWRRERRLAWRTERKMAAEEIAASDESASAALLESLLLRDIIAWSQGLTPAQRDRLLAMDPSRLPPHFLTPPDQSGIEPGVRRHRTDQAPRAATRRTTVEHLSGRCRQRRRPKQHGARAKTGRAVHHAARGAAQYCRGIRLMSGRQQGCSVPPSGAMTDAKQFSRTSELA